MTTRREYHQALDRLAGRVERAYIEAVRTVVDRASLGDIISGVAMADVEAVLGAMRMDSAALSLTLEEIRAAFIAGGMVEAEAVRILFDIRSPLAEQWLAQESAEFVTRITAAQRAAVRVALERGLALGQSPRQTALDIVGRVGRTGRRTGGLVGLADTQAAYVYGARDNLLSLDSHYFTRTRRDRRFDAVVRRAIETGTPLSRAQVDHITGRYADRLLQTRAQNIARTETIAALNAGREQAIQQAVSSGDIPPQFIERIWVAANDRRTRHSHAEMHGQRRQVGQPFRSPDGSLLMHPGDTSLGAQAKDVINCRCYMRTKIDHVGLAAYRSGGAA